VAQQVNNYVTRVSLKIFDVKKDDFGVYFCVAKNSLGNSDGPVTLSEREAPPDYQRPTSTTSRRPSIPAKADKKSQGRRRGSGGKRTRKTHKPQHNGNNNNLNTYSPFLPTKRSHESVTEPESVDFSDDKEDFFSFNTGCLQKSLLTWILSAVITNHLLS